MTDGGSDGGCHSLRILVVTQGQWGERIAANISLTAPEDWKIASWAAPRALPPVIDDPEDYLPASFQETDLLLALGDQPGLALLIPDIVSLSAARAVIAPIDRLASLPPGLARQLTGWLQAQNVAIVFPKPFCSLDETHFNRTPIRTAYDDPWIRAFAAHFGRPSFKVRVEQGIVQELTVRRAAACGCAQSVAQGLAGTPLDQALEQAGLLHHHFPCLACMNKDRDYADTLMHVSGNHLKDALREALGDALDVEYVRPQGRIDDGHS